MDHNYKQKEGGFMTYPAAGWRKWMFKAPVCLWRLGLGSVVGRFMLLVTHTGRKSGLPRRTMAEYYKLNGKKYVVAAFGRKAQWCLNMLSNPQVTIQSSDGAESATAVRVTDMQELEDVIRLFMRRDPPLTQRYLASLGIREDLSNLAEMKDLTWFFRFDPTDKPAPLPLKPDLIWVWPLLVAGVVILWLSGRDFGRNNE